MNNILQTIVAKKKEEVFQKKSEDRKISKQSFLNRNCISLKDAIINSETGVIAEFKRRSPSKGNINISVDVKKTTQGYINAGASALSVLTDRTFFGGENEDLIAAREANNCPILRKDFIIDETQIIEAKEIGADAILLIASILTPSETKKLAKFAKEHQLEVLLEIHTKEELNRINDFIDIVGVNNRNLNDFTVSIERSIELSNYIPKEFLKISESGLNSPEDILRLKESGYGGFLMGERFMAEKDPGLACKNFIKQLKKVIA